MYTRTITNKFHGRRFEPKNEKQGYVGNLSLQTTTQLKELLERQLKLLANKGFINKLEDKGQKIIKLKELIEEEINKRNENDVSLTNMTSSLKLQEDMNSLEWSGKSAPRRVTHQEDNEEEDEQNVLKMLATHSGAGFHVKNHKVIKPDKSLIKLSDLVNENYTAINKETEENILEKYAKHLCEKLDSLEVKADFKTQEKFLPFKTLNLSSNKKELRNPKIYWEVTAATPPTSVHGDTKMVTLLESIKLQGEQQRQLKEIQMRQASERLVASQQHWITTRNTLRETGSYRDPASSSSSDDENNEQDIEVNDSEDREMGSVVVYSLIDETSNE